MKKRNRVLSLLTAITLLLVFTLTGCGSGSSQSADSTGAQSTDAGSAGSQDSDSQSQQDETEDTGAAEAESGGEEEEDSLAKYAGTTVKLGIMGASDELVWDPIIAEFAEKDITIEKVFFSDYTQPNAALDSGDVDLNSFQHYTYMNNEIATFGYDITAIGDTLITALNLYSDKLSSVDELQDGDKIAIPNDAVNQSRALTVIQAAGLITLDPSVDNPEVGDIIDNPKNLEFVQVDASQTASLLPDVAAAIVNGGYAIDAGLSPREDSIFFDDPNYYTTNAYVNVIAARTEDADNELYLAIVKAYQSERTKEIYANDFQGSYIPAWKD